MPDRIQLKRYEEVFQNKGCSYALLSLVKDFVGLQEIQDSTVWQVHHYDELSRMISTFASSEEMPESHRVYINDYCYFINTLSQLAESWKATVGQTWGQRLAGNVSCNVTPVL